MRGTKERMRRLPGVVWAVFVMCVMFICISTTALAAEGKVTANPAAKIRESASTTSEQVGSAQNGAVLEILSEVTGTDGKIWYQVRFDNNKTGYIRSDLMTKLADTTASTNTSSEVEEVQPINCTVTGNQVNVRSLPSANGEKVAQVRKGEVMTVNGTATDSEGKTWYRVTFTSDNRNVTGYVRYDFVSLSGEIKPVEQQVEEPPVVDTPVEVPPVQDTPIEIPTLSKDYDTAQDEGVWYLIDNIDNKRYNLENVMDAAIKNPKIYDEIEGKVKAQKGWIWFLVILVILMGVAIALLVLKIKDVMDEAYFSAVEKETMRQRQGQGQRKGQGSGQRQGAPRQGGTAQPQKRSVMHTVGANGGNAQKSGAPRQGVPQMNIPKTGEGTPQTVKVSNPAETRSPKPVYDKPAQPKAVPTEDTKVMKPIESTVSKLAADASKQTWQSKNFMTDDDDDMEYGFLDWEEGDE